MSYFIHQFKNTRQIEQGVTEERSVVLLGPRDVEKWVAAVELRGEAKQCLCDPEDKNLIAAYIEHLIEIKKKKQKKSIIIQPVIGIIQPGRDN